MDTAHTRTHTLFLSLPTPPPSHKQQQQQLRACVTFAIIHVPKSKKTPNNKNTKGGEEKNERGGRKEIVRKESVCSRVYCVLSCVLCVLCFIQ